MVRTVENSGGESVAREGDSVLQPQEGMEFDSEDAAMLFYDEYARRVGFVMRVMSCRRSEVDKRILARRLGCNKEGYCVSIRVFVAELRSKRVLGKSPIGLDRPTIEMPLLGSALRGSSLLKCFFEATFLSLVKAFVCGLQWV
ncbi:unnamed protein product [Ilex paraguariensis]|uniref:FAR1 domain-containing protein n=1 Tax=Ilex paraguariensis TaxID=185542 RepID=A0ABC8UTF4_9AQUA